PIFTRKLLLAIGVPPRRTSLLMSSSGREVSKGGEGLWQGDLRGYPCSAFLAALETSLSGSDWYFWSAALTLWFCLKGASASRISALAEPQVSVCRHSIKKGAAASPWMVVSARAASIRPTPWASFLAISLSLGIAAWTMGFLGYRLKIPGTPPWM